MRLFAKLFVSYLLVVLLAEGVLFLSAELLAPWFYQGHVARMMHVMGMMGMGPMAAVLRADLEAGHQSTLTAALLASLPVATTLAAGAAWFVARRISRTVRVLAQGSERMARGDYRLRLPVVERDELGELARHFNRLAEALDRVEASRVELIGTVAHELRTPLSALQGYAEALADGVMPPERAAQAIAREVGAMRRLVDDLSLVSRVEAGAVEVHPVPVAARAVLEEALDRFAPAFAQKGVRLVLEAPEATPRVRADPERVQQVLSNLLANALRHTPPGGTVTLGARVEGEAVRFYVRDTGPGIPPEHQPRVFERFYRVDPARTRGAGGSGVGLTVAKGLVEAMGGRIGLESEPGRGAEFFFTLPLTKA